MASNYTQHVQLPLWEPDDDFLREEFNEGNQKIDAALHAANRYQLLKFIPVETDCSTLELDTSDLDWSQYHEVIMYAYLKGNSSNYAHVYLNGVTDSSGYKFCPSNGVNFNPTSAICSVRMEYQGKGFGSKLTFYPGGPIMNLIAVSWGAPYTAVYGVSAEGSGITGTNVTNIQLKASSGSILPGGTIYLYGIRK